MLKVNSWVHKVEMRLVLKFGRQLSREYIRTNSGAASDLHRLISWAFASTPVQPVKGFTAHYAHCQPPSVNLGLSQRWLTAT